LLDVGCGKVPLYDLYKNLIEYCVCLDRPDCVHGVEYVDAFVDLAEGLPVRSSCFDTVLASDVLEHSPLPALLVSEMARVLAPEGHLVLSVPFYYPLHEMPRDYFRFTETALRKMAEDAGLKVVLLQTLGGATEVLGDLSCKISAVLPLVGGALSSALRIFFSTLGRTFPGRWLSRATSLKFPLGYLMVARKDGPGKVS
jgi:SAM-dependent methyltransferase